MQAVTGTSRQGIPFGHWAAGIGAALVLVAGLVAVSGMTFDGLVTAMGKVPLWALPPIALAQAAMVVLAAWKWQMLLRSLSGGRDRIDLGGATAATTLGTLAGQVLPIQIVTPAARAMFARRRGIAPASALGSSVFEQMLDLLALAAFVATIAAVLLFGATPARALVIATLVALLATLLLGPSLRALAWLLQRLPRAGALGRGVRQAAQLPVRSLVWPMVLSVARIFLVAAINLGVLMLLVPGIDAMAVLLVIPVTQLALALPFLPAGLGLVEAGWIGVLLLQGLAAPEAAAVALSLRIILTVPFLAISPLLVAPGLRRRPE